VIKNIKRIAGVIFDNSLYELFKYLFISFLPASIGTFLVIPISQEFYKENKVLIFVFLFSLVFAIILLLNKLSDTFDNKSKRFDTNYECIQHDCEYVYNSEDEILFYDTMKIVSNKDNMKTYYDTYTWTGEGNEQFYVNSDEMELLFPNRTDIFQPFVVYFKSPLNRNEEIEIPLCWEINKITKKPIPFLSQVINIKHKELSMIMKINKQSFNFSKIECNKISLKTKKTVSTFSDHLIIKGNYLYYRWTIKNPRRGFKYKMTWS